ncbi:hypothetical protein HMPREF1326_02161 [Akkermansia sp. KLE1605]|nr:hypothetical protein HMPREF1326_02161 [Akkermansia sp. KLE1605]
MACCRTGSFFQRACHPLFYIDFIISSVCMKNRPDSKFAWVNFKCVISSGTAGTV